MKTAVPKDLMRVAFEAWAEEYGHDIARSPFNGHYYGQDECNDSWAAWQAALAAKPQWSATGLTPEQIDKTYRDVWSTVPHTRRLTAFAHAIYALSTQPQAPQGAVTDAERIDAIDRLGIVITHYQDEKEVCGEFWVTGDLVVITGTNARAVIDECIQFSAAPETPEGKK